MKEPKSRAAPAKASSEAKPAKAGMEVEAIKDAKPARPARARKAASAAKTAAVAQLPSSTRAAAKAKTRSRAPSVADYRKEIAGLRKEVEQLRAWIANIHEQSDVARGSSPAEQDAHPWLKIAATVGVTFALGKLMQALRIPAAAAVAVPMITAEVNRRFL